MSNLRFKQFKKYKGFHVGGFCTKCGKKIHSIQRVTNIAKNISSVRIVHKVKEPEWLKEMSWFGQEYHYEDCLKLD